MIVSKLHPAQAPKHTTAGTAITGTALARVDSSLAIRQRHALHGPVALQFDTKATDPNKPQLATEVAKVFIPGSVGAGLIGGTVDGFNNKAMAILKTNAPVVGNVLGFIEDAAAWLLSQVNNLSSSAFEGVIKFIPERPANSILQDFNKMDSKSTIFMDALKDTLFAIECRVTPTGSPATDMKQGRDTILAWLMDKLLSEIGVTKTANRLADVLYNKALSYGAKDYEAAAAAAYTLLAGTQVQSILPVKGISTVVYGVPIKLPGAVEGDKRISSIPAGALDKYLAMVGPDPKRTVEWLDNAFKAKSGGLIGGGSAKDAGSKEAEGSILPWVAGGAVLLLILSSRK